MTALRVLDLFSGIGGFSLGLEWTGGFRTVAFCEVDPFCRRVLAQHWPEVPQYDDVRTLTGERLGADGIGVDVICGGFPCQDISIAGRGAGIAGERSGLWSEFARLIGEIRPRFVIVENVAALLSRGLGDVLGDLAALGFDAEWHCITAAAVGAPHRRDRIWIIGYSNANSGRLSIERESEHRDELGTSRRLADGLGSAGWGARSIDMADAPGARSQGRAVFQAAFVRELSAAQRGGAALADADEGGRALAGFERRAGRIGRPVGASWWLAEPNVGRVAHGVPARVDRLRALGNAVVPQIPEMIGRAILEALEQGGLEI